MDENKIEIENVSVKDLAGVEFPPVNKNAVEAVAVSEKPASAPAVENEIKTPEGWNPEIHVSPPRKNKRGEWEKKRGNKKGYVFGKTKNEQPPPLNIPPSPEESASEAEKAAKLEEMAAEQTRAAAEMVSNGVFLTANAFSGYVPENAFRAAYVDAWERYLNTFGGVNLPPWCEVALMTGTVAVNAIRREEAKPKMQRLKEWIAGKIYAWRNRKKKRENAEANAA